jgi:Homeodomain-like domain
MRVCELGELIRIHPEGSRPGLSKAAWLSSSRRTVRTTRIDPLAPPDPRHSPMVELSVVEQRYQAAVIRDGVPIVQVARRFDVSRQAVHRWLRWYEAQGLPGARR